MKKVDGVDGKEESDQRNIPTHAVLLVTSDSQSSTAQRILDCGAATAEPSIARNLVRFRVVGRLLSKHCWQ